MIPPAQAAPALPYRPELDSLRAIAVAAVLLSHWHPVGAWGFNWGLAGVYLFFVISGYVVTRQLLADLQVTSSFASVCANFYLRRILRIWPIYFLMLAFAYWFWPGWPRQDTPWHAAFLSNYLFGWHAAYDFPVHLWSLSVEQQFYLLWPAVLLFARGRHFPWLCGLLFCLAPGSRGYFAGVAGNDQHAYYALTSNVDCLAVGALLAWVEMRGPSAVTAWSRCCGRVGLAGALALVGAIVFNIRGDHAAMIALGGTACALCSCWLIGRLPDIPLGKSVLHSPVLRYIGRISYGVYLYHLFVGIAVFSFLEPRLPQWAGAVIAAVCTVVLAAASWHLIERPILSWKVRFRPHSA